MSAEISVFSRRSHQRNLRTAAHNILLKDDDTFDLRMHAVSHLIVDINTIYLQSISALHTDLAEKVLKYRLWSNSEHSTPVLTISTGLSEADRHQVLQHIVNVFTQHSMYRHATISCNKLHHTEDILEAVYDALNNTIRMNSQVKRSGRRDVTVRGSAVERIRGLLEATPDTPDRIYVIIRDAELLSQQVLSDFVDTCDASLALVIVLMQNSAVPLPFPLQATASSRIALDMLATCTPWKLMDHYSGLLVLDEYLSCLLPPSLLCYLYSMYDSQDRCTHTFTHRLHAYVREHFHKRAALLSMFRHIPFLIDRKITATKGSLPTIYSRAVAQLMWYMDASDLSVCESFLDLHESRTVQAESLLNHLHDISGKHKLRVTAFNWLKHLRNKFLLSQERSNYPSIPLWEVCTHDYLSSTGDYEAALRPFFDALRLPLRNMSIQQLQTHLLSWSRFVNPAMDIDFGLELKNAFGAAKSRHEEFVHQLVAITNMLQYFSIAPSTACNSLQNVEIVSPNKAPPFTVMRSPDFHISRLVEQYIDALHEFIVSSIHSFLSQPAPDLITSITTLTSDGVARVMSHLTVNIRSCVTMSLLRDADADDMTRLYSLLQAQDKIDILTHELLDEFTATCTQWMDKEAPKSKGKRKRAEIDRSDTQHGKCRFLMALNELQKLGFVKVTATGNYVKKLIAS